MPRQQPKGRFVLTCLQQAISPPTRPALLTCICHQDCTTNCWSHALRVHLHVLTHMYMMVNSSFAGWEKTTTTTEYHHRTYSVVKILENVILNPRSRVPPFGGLYYKKRKKTAVEFRTEHAFFKKVFFFLIIVFGDDAHSVYMMYI